MIMKKQEEIRHEIARIIGDNYNEHDDCGEECSHKSQEFLEMYRTTDEIVEYLKVEGLIDEN